MVDGVLLYSADPVRHEWVSYSSPEKKLIKYLRCRFYNDWSSGVEARIFELKVTKVLSFQAGIYNGFNTNDQK